MKRKLFAVVLILTLSLWGAFPAFAAGADGTDGGGELTLHVTAETGGGELVYTFLAEENPGLAGFNLYLDYSKSDLTPKAVVQGSLLSKRGMFLSNLDKKTGTGRSQVAVAWANASGVSGSGVLFTVSFTLAKGVGVAPVLGLSGNMTGQSASLDFSVSGMARLGASASGGNSNSAGTGNPPAGTTGSESGGAAAGEAAGGGSGNGTAGSGEAAGSGSQTGATADSSTAAGAAPGNGEAAGSGSGNGTAGSGAASGNGQGARGIVAGADRPSPNTPKFARCVPSPQTIVFNDITIALEVYNIDGSNYFKLRDIACLLQGCQARFQVDYDPAARDMLTFTGQDYTENGSELATGTDKSASCTASEWLLKVDGTYCSAWTYNLGGNNFFKLRDLGTIFGFSVDYDQATDTALISSPAL